MRNPSSAPVPFDLAPVRPWRALFAPRPRRLATGPAPAAFIVLVWVLLWTWLALGVAAPLSRLGAPEPARAAQDLAQRA